MAAPVVEFFFDFISPYSYLAATRVDRMVARGGGTVRWRPFFLPGVLKAAGNSSPVTVPAKGSYMFKDLVDWAEFLGVPPLRVPDTFPFLAVAAGRVALALEAEGKLHEFSQRCFRRVWADGADVNDPGVLGELITSVGADAAAVLAKAQGQELKDALRANTDEAVRRGAFGAPTFFVGDEMFVGNDRLEFVERAVARLKEKA